MKASGLRQGDDGKPDTQNRLRKISRIVPTFLFLVLVQLSLGAASSGKLSETERLKWETDFQKRQQETKTFHAQFTQEFKLKGMKEGIVSSGEIFFQRPGSFLIHFQKPNQEVVFADGKEFYHRKEGSETIRKPISSKTPAERIVTLLRSLFESGSFNSNDFKIQMHKNKEELIVSLEPLNPDLKGKMVGIENKVRQSDLAIQSVVIRLKDEAMIRYSFLNQHRNLKWEESLVQKFRRIEPTISSQSKAIIPSQKR